MRTITPLGLELRERAQRMAEEQHREALLGLVDRQENTIRRLRRELRLTSRAFVALALALLGTELARLLM